jgi:hypothetical protein
MNGATSNRDELESERHSRQLAPIPLRFCFTDETHLVRSSCSLDLVGWGLHQESLQMISIISRDERSCLFI